MRIEEQRVMIIITLFSIGGATETVVSLAAGLKKRGINVDIVTGPALPNEGNMFSEAASLGLNVIVLDELVRDISIVHDLKAFFSLRKIISEGGYSIVHTHSSKAGVIGRIAAWFSRVPVIVHTIHGLPYHNYQALALANSYILIEKFCAVLSSKIISVTHAIIRNCTQNGIAREDKFIVIRSGLQLEQYKNALTSRESIRKKYGFSENDIVAGVISRIAPLKGHEYIIELAKRSKNGPFRIKYFLIGDGESGSFITSQIKTFHLEEFIICSGMVAPNEIPGMISAVDFIIHPSLREGLARVLPQSIIMNRKVITFNLDGVDEVITDGISGFSVETGNIDALFNACNLVCGSDGRSKIDETFRSTIETEFSSETMIEKHIHLYSELLAQIKNV